MRGVRIAANTDSMQAFGENDPAADQPPFPLGRSYETLGNQHTPAETSPFRRLSAEWAPAMENGSVESRKSGQLLGEKLKNRNR